MKKIKAGSFNPLPVSPVAVIGVNINGKPNYMTAGFISGVNIKPSIMAVSLNKNHLTPKGIIDNGTFSINIPSADFVVETDYCGLVSGKTKDKSEVFTSFYGGLETAPMIEEFPVTCECRYTGQKAEFDMDIVYFGEVIQVYINEDIIKDNKEPDITKINPIVIGIDNTYRRVAEPTGQAYKIGFDYNSHVMNNIEKFTIVEQVSRPVLSIRTQVSPVDIPKMIGQSLYSIAMYAGELGVQPSGAPFTVYHGMIGHNIDMEAGFTFSQKIDGRNNIQSLEIPPGKYASYIYAGSYEHLANAKTELHQWIKNNNYEIAGAAYEFYLNDPQTTLPEKLETQIIIQIK